MTTQKTLAIINPISGTGKQQDVAELLKKYLDKAIFDLEICYTEYAGHGTIIAKDAIESNIDTIIAVGGDGTINEIGKALINSEISLAIIPRGSGNGLARHLGIPMDTTKAIKHLNNTITRKIDVVNINKELSLNVSGIGFDAHISHEFAKLDKRGLCSYIKTIIKSFFSYENKEFELITSAKTIKIKAFMLSLANSSQFGNNAYIAPTASLTDGEFHLVAISKPSIIQLPKLIFLAFTKQLHKSKLIRIITTSEIEIRHSEKIAHIDGEPINISSTVFVNIIPSALNILVNPAKEI